MQITGGKIHHISTVFVRTRQHNVVIKIFWYFFREVRVFCCIVCTERKKYTRSSEIIKIQNMHSDMKRAWLKLNYIQSSTFSLIYVFWFDMILARSPTPLSNRSHAAHHTIWKIWRAHIKKTKAFIKVQISSVTVSHASHATKKTISIDFFWFSNFDDHKLRLRRTTTESVGSSMKNRKEFFDVSHDCRGKMQKMRRVNLLFLSPSRNRIMGFFILIASRARTCINTLEQPEEHRHLKWKVEY